MPGPAVILGERRGPFDGGIDADLLRRYAAATNDPSPLVRDGRAVPPVALVTRIWEAQNTGRDALVPQALQQSATGGVHGEHDVLVHRPIAPGEPLRIWVEGHGARPAGRHAAVTLRYTALDADDRLVAEQWWTTLFLGTTCAPVGAPPPDHTFPDGARERAVGTHTVEVDVEMARRYAGVSGDWSPHHFDPEAARRSGYDRPFLHGVCTMALCAQGVVALVADGDPACVRRVAVRFAMPIYLGERVDVHVFDAGPLGYAFEAHSGDTTVISHGRAELHP